MRERAAEIRSRAIINKKKEGTESGVWSLEISLLHCGFVDLREAAEIGSRAIISEKGYYSSGKEVKGAWRSIYLAASLTLNFLLPTVRPFVRL